MSVGAKLRPLATAAELLSIPEEERFHEIIDGELVRKATPSGPHGRAQRALGGRIGDPYDRRPGGGRPGGWWIVTEVEIEIEKHEVFRPDLSGWRRDRLPELPRVSPIQVRPDWVCEVLSRSNARNDLVKKMRVVHRCAEPHYWVVDPEEETLAVYRWTAEGYLLTLSAERDDRVRAEPFGDVEISLAGIFGGGVFVMARSHAPVAFPSFARFGNDILVVWDEEDEATDPYLHAAILLGLALASPQRRPDDAGDIEALADIEHRIRSTVRSNPDGSSKRCMKSGNNPDAARARRLAPGG